MSGHSKWSTIRRKKAVIDAKRGKVFTKYLREITTAARIGGGDPGGNPRLRVAIEKARESNMPMDNIKRAIQKGTGALEGETYEELTYEGYGPGGVAILIDAMTDNRQRTAAEVRSTFSKHGGNMGQTGSVGHLFKKKGFLTVDRGAITEDDLLGVVMDAGAEDLKTAEKVYEITTEPGDYEK